VRRGEYGRNTVDADSKVSSQKGKNEKRKWMKPDDVVEKMKLAERPEWKN